MIKEIIYPMFPGPLRRLLIQIEKHRISSISAELSYYFFLSIFPFLIFMVTAISYFPIQIETMLSSLKPYMPDNVYTLVEKLISEILASQNAGLLSFGLIAALWVSSKGIHSMIRAFNLSYEVEEKRTYIRERSLSIVLTIAMIFVIILSFVLPVFGRKIGILISQPLGLEEGFLKIWGLLSWTSTSVVLFVVFSGLYYFGPNMKLKLRDVLYGSVFATGGWLIVSYFFSLYVNRFANFGSTYGSLGGIIVLLIWFYLTGFLILVGGEINALACQKRGSGFKEATQSIRDFMAKYEKKE